VTPELLAFVAGVAGFLVGRLWQWVRDANRVMGSGRERGRR
jgi:hypothetical protein